MDIGMLWYQDSPKMTLAEKVNEAAAYYKSKYGVDPDTCFVNPESLNLHEGKQAKVGMITLRPNKTIIKNHFWLGVETKKSTQSGGNQKSPGKTK